MGTYDIVKRPVERTKIVKNKWVLAHKKNEKGEIVRYKARLVAKGFTQIEGVDYFQVFSPVLRFDTVRFLLAITAERNWELQQFDVKTAFLHGDLEEHIFMELPHIPTEVQNVTFKHLKENPITKNKEKLPKLMKNKGENVLQLKKALYGLKQSSREWFKKFTKLLNDCNLTVCNCDPCLFRNEERNLYVIIYVDDFLVTAASMSLIEKLWEQLATNLTITNLGQPKVFVGIQIQRNRERGTIAISQQNYIGEIIDKFKLQNSHATVPMNPAIDVLEVDPQNSNDVDKLPYRELIGCLMYVSIQTRPDIAYAVSLLARHFMNYNRSHWNSAKQVAKYLNSTKKYSLVYGRNTNTEIRGFCDVDWAGDKDRRKSTTGIVYTIGCTAFLWKSKLQSIVASSTMEAEYVAMAQCSREALWIRKILKDLNMTIPEDGLRISSDNVMALNLAIEKKQTVKSKHIDVCYNLTQDYSEKKWIKLEYLSGKEMPADGLTKPLNKVKFADFVHHLGFKDTSI